MQARDANGRFIKGETTDRAQDMTDTTDTTRNYIVPVSALFMWPIHVGAWLVATIVRGVVLVLILCALVALYGAWQGQAESCPVGVDPVAYHPAISA